MTAREAAGYQPIPVAVVDLASEFTEVPAFRRCRGYLCLPTLDGTTPSEQQLLAGVSHISRHLANGSVYVHCALGHGRSATLVVAFLLLTNHAQTIEDAVAMVRAKRPHVGLKPSYVAMLRKIIEGNA
jgi:protein-tyrosine phosphatase